MAIKEDIDDMNSMIIAGKAMDAFEKYYDESVVMQENENPPVYGKEVNRKRETEFFDSLAIFHGAQIKAVAVGDGVSIVEWVFDVTPKGMPRHKMNQVAVQRWNRGKILSEKFYYYSEPKK